MPTAVSVAAAVLLGAVFVISSVTKLAAPGVWYAQSADLGVPRPVAVVVPYLEAVLSGWLVVQWHRAIAATVAAVVLSAFTALIAVRLAQGRRPVCACFGALSARPISARTVARNVVFVGLAVLTTL
ncbi:MAG: MauE/DoxX family redox-associated membrane protein [Ilumatobacteraceae bacterium]